MSERLAYFTEYDKSKFSVPWVCRVKENGEYDFSERVGGFSGRDGDEGYLVVFNPIKSQVYGYGQRFYSHDKYSIIKHAVWNGEEFLPCDKFGITIACNKDELKTIDDMSTADIINYLMKRDGVDGFRVEPYNKRSVIVEGPAVVIIVTD